MSQPKLQITSDYSKFELCQFNRDVNKTKALKDSMKSHGYIAAYPIHAVRSPHGKLQIKAGHHRFEVAQQLGLSVFYVVSDDSATVHELEKATVRWSIRDYLESFIRCGLEDYIEVSRFAEQTKISIGICVSILGGEAAVSGNKLSDFKAGKFKVTEDGRDHGRDIAQILLTCRKIAPKVCEATFVRAISRCLFVPEFDKNVFITRAQANWHLLKPCKTIALMTEVIESIYNHGAHANNRLPVAFLADKVMKERSIWVKA
jgi:hypothetical protein